MKANLAMNKDVLHEHLRTINAQLLTSRVNVTKVLLPQNLDAERAKFLTNWATGDKLNPQFTYAASSATTDDLLEMLESLNLANLRQEFGLPIAPLQSFAHKILDANSLIRACATPEFTAASLAAHGAPDQDLIALALEIVNIPLSTPSIADIDAGIAVERCAAALSEYHLDNWQINLRQQTATRISVDSIRRCIYIRQNAMFSLGELDRLLVHEIGTHVLRSVNGRRQPHYPILAQGLYGYIATEEGLALYNEFLTGTIDNKALRHYGLRVLAVHWALQHDFFTTFSLLTDFLSPEDAFDLTLRVKRGCADMNQPGSYTKDYLYLAGWRDIDAYVKQGGDLTVLYVGKIGLADISIMNELLVEGYMNQPTLLPFFYDLPDMISP